MGRLEAKTYSFEDVTFISSIDQGTLSDVHALLGPCVLRHAQLVLVAQCTVKRLAARHDRVVYSLRDESAAQVVRALEQLGARLRRSERY